MPEFNKILDQLSETPAGTARNALLNRACAIIDEQANMVALVSKPDYIAYRSDMIDARFGETEGNFNTFKYMEEFTSKRP